MHNHSTSFVFVLVVLIIGLGSANFDFIALSRYFMAQAGSAIGVSASVPPNPFNTLAKQIKEKEDELNLRERDVNAREQALEKGKERGFLVYGSFGMLLLLVMANFYLDYKRRNFELRV